MSDNQRQSKATNKRKWGPVERRTWLDKQSIKRSYQEDVISKIEKCTENFTVTEYGALEFDSSRYPVYVLKSKNFSADKPTVLITGGVHGYETSGVQGAIRFVETSAAQYSKDFNIVVAPCISPWGYETINRWNPYCVDPNRSFYSDSPSDEAAALMQMLAKLETPLLAHIDLHETTDTDNSEFMPALDARDATETVLSEIPDGFYLVGDLQNPCIEFQRSIIQSVAKVTHIAPADKHGCIIGASLSQPGVINYPTKKLGLCSGFSNARFSTTTEVYPDSPKVNDENCILAQVNAVQAALDFILAQDSAVV